MEVVGALEAGCAITFMGDRLRPHVVMCIKAFLMIPCLMVMMKPEMFPHAFNITVFISAYSSSGWLVALSTFVHEEYGTGMFGVIFGSFLTAGAAGLFAFNEILYAQVIEGYAEYDSQGRPKPWTEYGEWNQALFGIAAGSAFMAFMVTIVSYCAQRMQRSRSLGKGMSIEF